ncbi:MAG: glutamate--tRNA ligase [Proteobacteria bacterium]|nr:glutamate--tRNA ligase [Pseudomonadota bacterium]
MSKVKTRFAPSPTGFLHIGGARTALFNWLFARHHEGSFVLRIEDTDLERSTQESVDAIFEGMQWLGLDWDEGPYYQSQRSEIYYDHIEKMLGQGKAYRCYCKPDELEVKRAKAMAEGKKPKYDGKCRELTVQGKNNPFTIRFKAPQSGQTVVDDMIKGRVSFENNELDDLIIARSDGSPTYNFVVVVDDATMGITHILRGDDHLNNTPRQILLYQSLGYNPPIFGHVPLILGQDKKRLSKRHGATSVMAYKEMGYLAEALVNYLSRLGWSHGDQEIFSIEELIDYFDSDHIGKSAGVFDEDKLLWLNAHYIKESTDDNLALAVLPLLKEKGCEVSTSPPLPAVINVVKDRAKTLLEIAQMSELFYVEEITFDEKAVNKFLTSEVSETLEDVMSGISAIEDFNEESIADFFNNFTESKGLKLGKVAQPVRVAITGGTVSPGIFEVIHLLGKDQTVKRIKNALARIS